MTIRENELQNPKVLHMNRLSPRANLIPAKKTGVYYRNKEESSLLQSLNGNFRFRYCQSDIITDFYKPGYNDTSWDIIDVPSMWQYRGYGKCQYPNVQYPIPFNPPFVCCDNPVGYYRKNFIINHPIAKTILHFGGVDNAFYVYINGIFAGFSKGSRLPSEFDISRYVRTGENEIAVKVFTYSDATYLENQDMLLASGIFRDIYLLHLGMVSIWDFKVSNSLTDITIEATLDYHGEKGYQVIISLDEQEVALDAAVNLRHRFIMDHPKLWNAEEPNLYNLTITLIHDGKLMEIHSKRVGMMVTCVKGNQFLVNNTPIYVKGINRHEHDCKNGRAVSVELIEKELKLIKSNNINAIRCSHYTNNPAFYEIATELGLYVMDEADIETHGCEVTGDQGYLSKNEEWLPAYMDRVIRMLESNKNETCIFMWSIGNECGRGENLEKCADYIRKFDPTTEVMQVQDDSVNPKYTKFRKAGYCTLETMKDFGIEGYPLILVEYAHCMGNSPGFLEGYWDYIYTHEHCIGGFVWEFKSQGFYQQDKDGNQYYLYGGDFDDINHWSNFSIDGIVMSDGTPKPTWYELGEVLAPTYVKWNDGIEITNKNDFKSLDYLSLKWEICEDYKCLRRGEMQLPALKPRKTTMIDIDLKIDRLVAGARYRANLYFYDGTRKIASRQIPLPYYVEKTDYRPDSFKYGVTFKNCLLSVKAKNFQVVFEKGLMTKYVKNNINMIESPMKINFYRAPIDNDGIVGLNRRNIAQWDKMFLKTFRFWQSDMTVSQSDHSVDIVVQGKSLPISCDIGFDLDIAYRIFKDGIVLIAITGKPYGAMPDPLPRIGVSLELNKEYEHVAWYGRGPRENYSDSKLASLLGYYESSVREMNVIYDVPQETGNHENTIFARITDHHNHGICIVGSDEFAFSYHDFTQENLIMARHKNELKKASRNYLYLDYKMRGLGSRSCGPDPEESFELHPHTFRFVFALMGDMGNTKALELSRNKFGINTEKLSDNYRPDGHMVRVLEYAACDL